MKTSRPLKSKTSSFRLDTALKKPVNDWLQHNPEFNLSRLINMAIRKLISKKQVLESVETMQASDKKVEKSVNRMMKKHAHMLEKLK
ncbi:MAG: hypothetical protein A3F42_00635 [Gammaproteobacteria bacterium RIFCSPHIGHO2_12_FULL_37_34]|nr:MAG: hypothetical protein A3F42_00635 [Gammaproteobacteria bacterium RIFCSPHIGHO2_12_FULL_37_34]